jgi:hypothetical protein
MDQTSRWKLTKFQAVILCASILFCLSNPGADRHLYGVNEGQLWEFTYGEPWEWDSAKILIPSSTIGWAKKGWRIEYRNYGFFSTTVCLGKEGEKLLTVGALYVVVDMRK